jgi:hypothetical protein
MTADRDSPGPNLNQKKEKKRRKNPLGHQRGESCEQLRPAPAAAAERSWSQESRRGRAVGETCPDHRGGVAAARVCARQLPLRGLARPEARLAAGGAVGGRGRGVGGGRRLDQVRVGRQAGQLPGRLAENAWTACDRPRARGARSASARSQSIALRGDRLSGSVFGRRKERRRGRSIGPSSVGRPASRPASRPSGGERVDGL